ncbi:MAG: LysR family transcriptional regulator [Parvularculaceae bacterium]|nr:LysR family transcriptional regulator [Parvularculaceae bacterium]
MSRLEELEAFVAIAKTLSITRAADRLGLAKSAASRRLSDLERRLGVPLFHRTTRRMHLTAAGDALLARAARILDDVADAETAASAGATSLAGALRIAAPHSFGLLHLRPIVEAFHQQHPAVRVEVDYSDRRVDLVGEGYDIGVRIGRLADSSLVARRLCAIRDVVAASPAFWRKHGRPRRPSDLAALPCLAYSNLARPGSLRYWGPGGEEGVVEASIRSLANDGQALAALAEAGVGYVVEPLFILHEAIRDARLEPVLLDYAWSDLSLSVVWPPSRQMSARVRAFSDAVIARFADNPYWDDVLVSARRGKPKKAL